MGRTSLDINGRAVNSPVAIDAEREAILNGEAVIGIVPPALDVMGVEFPPVLPARLAGEGIAGEDGSTPALVFLPHGGVDSRVTSAALPLGIIRATQIGFLPATIAHAGTEVLRTALDRGDRRAAVLARDTKAVPLACRLALLRTVASPPALQFFGFGPKRRSTARTSTVRRHCTLSRPADISTGLGTIVGVSARTGDERRRTRRADTGYRATAPGAVALAGPRLCSARLRAELSLTGLFRLRAVAAKWAAAKRTYERDFDGHRIIDLHRSYPFGDVERAVSAAPLFYFTTSKEQEWR